MTDGTKFDEGKLPWGLLPWDAVGKVVVILQYGAKKYAPRNWEKGMDWSRPFGALMRHLTQWWNGEGKDPETGYSHLWHAMCNLMFLVAYELRGVGKDDRPAVRPVDDTGDYLVQSSLTGEVMRFAKADLSYYDRSKDTFAKDLEPLTLHYTTESPP